MQQSTTAAGTRASASAADRISSEQLASMAFDAWPPMPILERRLGPEWRELGIGSRLVYAAMRRTKPELMAMFRDDADGEQLVAMLDTCRAVAERSEGLMEMAKSAEIRLLSAASAVSLGERTE